ncbi:MULTISPECIES: DUF6800 family protein [Gimesia]|jgi:uncharacterized membrane protein|uniref:Uncharacterized protein n=2 Tax=Gimesia TaxID=1649453 RepID=A0A517V9R8_9PLAN|nr:MULTISPECIES: DUF6800 family protein [Gimesia]MCA9007786.1 hypothetical protein [Planctomycetaceae bacterium]EDL56117.1 hypothetical protein PM8797T_01594 [Gimesia maris DSM 8797]MCA9021517.1 hypothetical protein [Planctomycetaceae bacterium]QDT78721.1 hypothetical protein Mal35_21710 [Gimesia maris]QDT89752.1 hypothetical protein Pan161_13840 [Gimesia algae]|tara:strand:+ start:392 stop:562 length:171 start_codon:yes stop_codon:yes gene_type:complete
MGRVEKGRELAQRRVRKHKLKQLRAKFAKAKDPSEKEAIKEKVRKISPFTVLEESA